MTEIKNIKLLFAIIVISVFVGGVVIRSTISDIANLTPSSKVKTFGEATTDNTINKNLANFKLSPGKGVFFKDATEEIKIKVNTGGVKASVIQASLSYTYTYDPELKIIDADNNSENGIQIKPGKIKTMNFITNKVIINEAEKLVTIDLAAVLKDPNRPFATTKDVIFGTIKLKGTTFTQGKTISFDQGKSKIVSDLLNEDILSNVENGIYTIR